MSIDLGFDTTSCSNILSDQTSVSVSVLDVTWLHSYTNDFSYGKWLFDIESTSIVEISRNRSILCNSVFDPFCESCNFLGSDDLLCKE